ncbi:MAG: 5-(carboxyamino)imidazole ribonucleotide mutase [Acidobacteriota bacterium]
MSEEPRVAVLMGSKNDFDVMKAAVEVLREFGVPYEVRVLSAHRTPHDTAAYVEAAESRGIEVFIAGAGFAAHLAGVVAAHTVLPVIGVPIDSSALAGVDALYATVQMPGGIPVATMAIGKAGAKNAGLFAVQILSRKDASLVEKLKEYRRRMREEVLAVRLEG